jgi:hypothetical protein
VIFVRAASWVGIDPVSPGLLPTYLPRRRAARARGEAGASESMSGARAAVDGVIGCDRRAPGHAMTIKWWAGRSAGYERARRPSTARAR